MISRYYGCQNKHLCILMYGSQDKKTLQCLEEPWDHTIIWVNIHYAKLRLPGGTAWRSWECHSRERRLAIFQGYDGQWESSVSPWICALAPGSWCSRVFVFFCFRDVTWQLEGLTQASHLGRSLKTGRCTYFYYWNIFYLNLCQFRWLAGWTTPVSNRGLFGSIYTGYKCETINYDNGFVREYDLATLSKQIRYWLCLCI